MCLRTEVFSPWWRSKSMRLIWWICYSISWMYILPCWLSSSFKWVCDQYYESYTHFPSQFHHVRWEFVKVFQHRCEYKGSKPTMALFLHLFKVKVVPSMWMVQMWFPCGRVPSMLSLTLIMWITLRIDSSW